MRQAKRLLVLLLVTSIFAVETGGVWRALFVWFALVIAGVMGGILLRRPLWMGKRPDGSFPWWSLVLWAPWHGLTRLLASVQRRVSPPGASDVGSGLWVGAWPLAGDAPSDAAIVDLTAELPRRVATPAYFCAPTWDHTAPDVADIERAVAFAVGERRRGRPVLIHCAHGRGRSATVACAVMIALGDATGPEDAFTKIRSRRAIHMNREQQTALAAWAGVPRTR